MSKLEVVYRLGLAHPLLVMDNTSRSATAHFPETGNTVQFNVCDGVRWPDDGHGAFEMILLHVERECDPQDREVAHTNAKLDEWGVVRDAATVLGRVLSYLRDEEFPRTVAGYPAVVSENPQSNPAVRIAEAEVLFDGQKVTTLPLTGFPSIQIAPGVWDRVCDRLQRGEDVPAYRGFLLDAYYFATSGDPLRAVVMGCAAWETALRRFLSSSGVKVPGRANNLPGLLKLAQETKGNDRLLRHPAETLPKLAQLRNKLLHEGRKDLAAGDVVDMILAVDAAIIWLFRP